jgi:hypothetical protein
MRDHEPMPGFQKRGTLGARLGAPGRVRLGGSGNGGASLISPHVWYGTKSSLRRRLDHVDRFGRERPDPMAANQTLLAEEVFVAEFPHVSSFS